TVDPTRSPPPVSIALLYVCFNKGCIDSEFTPSARGEEIVFDKKFTLSPPTVPEVMSRTVATVLRREKPDGADWTIMVAERNFFVHSEAFASKSQLIQNILNDGPIEKMCILHSALRYASGAYIIIDHTMIIPLIYGAAVPLPRHDARLIPLVEDSIRQIFDAEYLQSFLAPQWERAICKRALALPLTVRSFFPVFRLLTIIWCFPRGWMPVAKRVAIGVMADIVHLHGGVNVNAFLRDQAAKIVPLLKKKDLDHWMAIMDSMLTHLYQVSSVLKNGPRDEMDEEEEEVDGWTYEERDGEDVNPATVNITPSEMVDPLFTEGSTVQVENANKIEQVASHTGEFHITFEADDSTYETREGQAKGEEFNAPAFTKESKKAVALSVERMEASSSQSFAWGINQPMREVEGELRAAINKGMRRGFLLPKESKKAPDFKKADSLVLNDCIPSFEAGDCPNVTNVTSTVDSLLPKELHLSSSAVDDCLEVTKTRDDPDEEEWHDEDIHGSFNPADPKCKCAIS
ncbi:hypothetical protein PRIPAC_71909, partial [Pristionchus pacificus]|uniref:Uncharacterized protein n=1 Tax=Pristionchus pacificus TaxID=54126 RepID=A0A2A6C5R3_PRIPA